MKVRVISHEEVYAKNRGVMGRKGESRRKNHLSILKFLWDTCWCKKDWNNRLKKFMDWAKKK